MAKPSQVQIIEVGPRDGLQNEKEIVSAADKVRFIGMLVHAGLTEIEVGAFVSPKWVPQMATTADVVAGLGHSASHCTYSVLVPNEQGFDAAIAAGIKKMAVFTAASESFNKKNINCTVDESFARFAPVLAKAKKMGVALRGYVSTAFVCPYEGPILPTKTIAIVRRLVDAGVTDISIGDTVGQATPLSVSRLLEALLKVVPSQYLALHFHDTYGAAIANVRASLDFGVARFDSSSGGLGGCPYAPGASGNVATDDLVWFLHAEGLQTGVDLNRLNEASRFIQDVLKKKLPSRVLAARQPRK